MGLVQVQVLRRTPLGDQDHIRPLLDVDAVYGIQKRAARPVGQGYVARHGFHNILLPIQDHVEHKIRAHHGGGLLDILPDRIALQQAGAGLGTHHAAVIGLDSGSGGHAGHDGLRPTGVPGKIVVFDVAQADSPVRFRHPAIDVHRRVVPVAAQGENQDNIFPPDPGGIQLVQKYGHHFPGGHGPGNVAGNHGDGFSGPYQFPEAGRSDGMRQRLFHRRPSSRAARERLVLQNSKKPIVLHCYHLDPRADFKGDIHLFRLPSLDSFIIKSFFMFVKYSFS